MKLYCKLLLSLLMTLVLLSLIVQPALAKGKPVPEPIPICTCFSADQIITEFETYLADPLHVESPNPVTQFGVSFVSSPGGYVMSYGATINTGEATSTDSFDFKTVRASYGLTTVSRTQNPVAHISPNDHTLVCRVSHRDSTEYGGGSTSYPTPISQDVFDACII